MESLLIQEARVSGAERTFISRMPVEDLDYEKSQPIPSIMNSYIHPASPPSPQYVSGRVRNWNSLLSVSPPTFPSYLIQSLTKVRRPWSRLSAMISRNGFAEDAWHISEDLC